MQFLYISSNIFINSTLKCCSISNTYHDIFANFIINQHNHQIIFTWTFWSDLCSVSFHAGPYAISIIQKGKIDYELFHASDATEKKPSSWYSWTHLRCPCERNELDVSVSFIAQLHKFVHCACSDTRCATILFEHFIGDFEWSYLINIKHTKSFITKQNWKHIYLTW